MNLPYKKCKCCGKRIGFIEWWKDTREAYKYLMFHAKAMNDGTIGKKEMKEELKNRFEKRNGC